VFAMQRITDFFALHVVVRPEFETMFPVGS